ncbi:MAG TPA: ATP-binding protein [Clostridia bacterium]|nr:ATP-binding protein [Clostridia bacterium]HPK15567.1 ATP-binding protein [Clostridia bacterium]
MEIAFWILAQVLLCAGIYWFMARRLNRAAGVAKKRPPVKVKPKEEDRELRDLRAMRARALNVPLAEKTRPARMEDIIGQEEGVRALRAAMCGPNPQHVIIYGPPGIGKTCAARLVLEEAKRRTDSPFDAASQFVEIDATCVRFDERSIADPLIGSVHDPIYQGAGVLGTQGVPQPKPGAVTRAHCGVLFLDEIGELHPVQMNKLLKVLEDRRVFFDSAYYSPDNAAIPPYIHDIFRNGLPADFRLVGATTRSPEELSPALRSRCVELFFRPLGQRELMRIASGAAERIGLGMDEAALAACAQHSASGRDAVNIVQLAGGAAMEEGRARILESDVLWVAQVCHHARRVVARISDIPRAGVCAGLAVSGMGQGAVIEIECSASRTSRGMGTLSLGGMVEEEELELRGRRLRRKGTARVSAETACEAFFRRFNVDYRDYDISFNVPGGIPMDGPSAGVALCVALMSAVTGRPPVPLIALTGEVTSRGEVRPVGGVPDKLAAAVEAGAKLVVIPEANYEEAFDSLPLRIVPVSDVVEAMRAAFGIPCGEEWLEGVIPLSASEA